MARTARIRLHYLGQAGDVAAGGQGAGVAGAKDPCPVGQQFLEEAQRPGRVPALTGPGGDLVADGQGAGVVVALDAAAQRDFLLAVVEGLLIFAQGVVVGGQGGVQAKKIVFGGGGCFAEVAVLASPSAAVTGPALSRPRRARRR